MAIEPCDNIGTAAGRRIPMVATCVVAILLLSACRGGSSHPGSTATRTPPISAEDTVRLARDAVRAAGSYRVTVVGHNFVLPQWGGIDGATVVIDANGAVARADLERTGDGRYTVLTVASETFFQRSTCPTVARIPGGGPDVLLPFLVATNGYLDNATGLTSVAAGEGVTAIRGRFGDFGAGTIEIANDTHRPLKLTKERDPAAGTETTWTFSDWGVSVAAERPSGEVPDQGPGGNPC